MNPAKTIAHLAGLPESTIGTTINMACGSGLQAIFCAAQDIALGGHGCAIAGGSEAMSDTPFLLPGFRFGYGVGHREAPDAMLQDGLRCPITGMLMGETIEILAKKHGVKREEADGYALESHRRASNADFSMELVAHERLGSDECARTDTTIFELATLKPVYGEGGQVTAGNASAISDGAAAIMLADPDFGGECHARILGWAESGLGALDMGFGPVPATQSLLQQHGLCVGDISLWELNEAFAAQVICCARVLGLPMDRLNVAGGGISLGHPIGASGARTVTTLINQLRMRGGGLGVATLGVGGGIGQALLVECR
jgi:acetyl-CoA C-acetyltransferase